MIKKHTYQVSIPKPCSQSWDKMEPVQGGRFCDSCQKKVTDLSGKTAEEVLVFLMKNPGSCAKIPVKHLNKPIEYRIPVIARKYHWPAIAAMLVAGMFYTSVNLSAHDNTIQQHEQTPGVINPTSHDPYQSSLFNDTIFYIKGVVKDDNGEVVPFASIDIEWNGKILTGQYADIDGYFNILLSANYQQETLIIKVSSVGLNNLTMTYPPGSLGKEHLVIELKSGVTIKGLIILSTPPMIKKNKTIDDHTFDRNDLMTFPR